MTDFRTLVLACIHGTGDYDPIIGNPVLWRTQGECAQTCEVVPVVPSLPWWDVPADAVWDASKGDGFDVLGTAPTRYNAKGERNKNARDIIRFRASNYETEVDRNAAKSGKIKDPYKPTAFGIGYYGEPDGKTRDGDNDVLYKAWHNMLHRCYDISSKDYLAYGGAGVRVCTRWYSFAAFSHDARMLPGYVHKLMTRADFALDKDHYGGTVYGPDTCIWLPRKINGGYINTRPFEAVSPDGEVFYHVSASEFARDHGLTQSKVSECLTKGGSHKGWVFTYTDENVRYQAYSSPIRDSVQALRSHLDHEFDVEGIRVHIYEDNGLALEVTHPQPVDEAVSVRVYWTLAAAMARAVGLDVAYIIHDGVLVDGCDVVVHESVQHPNDLKAEHLRLQDEPEYVKPEHVFGGRVYEIKHGDVGSTEYMTWQAMNNRCSNSNFIHYRHYGGRGITVCDRWRSTTGSYANFLEDMGRKPGPDYSIDRIDVNGPYSPENCRWASKSEQSRNRRNTKQLTFNGVTKPMMTWAEEYDLSPHTLRSRLMTGWTVEAALTTAADERFRRV